MSPFSAGGAQHHPHFADEEAGFLFLCLPKRPGDAEVDAGRSVPIPIAFLLLPCGKQSQSWLQHITPGVRHWSKAGRGAAKPQHSEVSVCNEQGGLGELLRRGGTPLPRSVEVQETCRQ